MIAAKFIMNPLDFSVQEIHDLCLLADNMQENPNHYQDACRGKLLATLFYEPSTRTRLSFESAIYRLGGSVIGFSDPTASSVSKGESLADTTRTTASYADIIVMRHPKEGAPQLASYYSCVPVINAGDGGHQHPTQTLTDLYTLHRVFGRITHLKIALCGDLKFGRTVHSFIQALARYEGIELILVSPNQLQVPAYLQEYMVQNKIKYTQTTHLESILHEVDVLYMTRIQKERFASQQEYEKLKDSYILDTEKMKLAKKDMIIMHPLPRVNEIATEVDDDPRAVYFTQAQNGMFIRMALILSLLDKGNPPYIKQQIKQTAHPCENQNCITKTEQVPAQMVQTQTGNWCCSYCGGVKIG